MVAAVAVLVAIVVAIVALVDRDSGDTTTRLAPTTNVEMTSTATDEQQCTDVITMFVDTDSEMQQIAERLRGDERIQGLVTETKQEAYEHYKIIFKDHAEPVAIARAEALPASVRVRPAPGITRKSLADHLRTEFPAAKQVNTVPTGTLASCSAAQPGLTP